MGSGAYGYREVAVAIHKLLMGYTCTSDNVTSCDTTCLLIGLVLNLWDILSQSGCSTATYTSDFHCIAFSEGEVGNR